MLTEESQKRSLARIFPSRSLIKEVFRVCRVSELSTVMKPPKVFSLSFTAGPKQLLTADVHHDLMHFPKAFHNDPVTYLQLCHLENLQVFLDVGGFGLRAFFGCLF